MNCKNCGKFWEECQCDDASAKSRAGEAGANLTDKLGAELYMDATDYDHELGRCTVALYASVDDLKASRACVAECGIVAVRVEFVRLVEHGMTYSERGNNAPNAEVTGVPALSARPVD